MFIDDPLHTLDIIVDEDNDRAILRANKTKMLGKGTKEYILSYRSELLSNRGYIVPEDWDYEWNVHVGPIWSPAATEDITQTDIVSWILPEYFVADATDATKITKAADRNGNNDFVAHTLSSKWPSFSTVKLNNHSGIEFDGSDDFLQCQNQSMWGIGSGGYMFACVVTSQTDQNNKMYVASYGEDDITLLDNEPAWAVAFDTTGGLTDLQSWADEGNITYSTGWDTNPMILIAERAGTGSNEAHIRQRGTEIKEGTLSGSIVNPTAADTGMTLAAIDTDSNPDGEEKFLDGVIYEAIWIDTAVSEAIQEKIEGYLAHKYALTADLPSTHPYKTDPPRQSQI